MTRLPTALWRRAIAGAALGGYVLASGVTTAHTGGSTGYAAIEVSGNVVRYSLTLSPVALPRDIAEDIRGAIGGQELSRRRLVDLIRRNIRLRAATVACEPGPGFVTAAAADVERVTIVVDYVCLAEMQQLTVRDDVFDVLGADHHTLARIQAGEITQQFAFAPDVREARVVLRDTADSGRGTRSFVVLGLQHIVTGYDHLLFLLGLLLPGGTFVSLLKIVTAFTVAHSLTLALAVVGVVVLPDRLVEAVIALSIAFVAAENLAPRPAVSRRWAISFLFGLVHGFGFSSALRELGLARQGLALSLLGFNVGVEAGQALVIAALLPGLVLLRRSQWEARTVMGSSLAILLIGLMLFVERAFL
jgi:hypothetical protein